VEGTEQCDDGNFYTGDGCGRFCELEHPGVCGNGIIEVTEECDDGNRINGDGCSAYCLRELIASQSVCGNGIVEWGEECDDGNRTSNDGCSGSCRIEITLTPRCGDGFLDSADGEECDDGNRINGDGCSAYCLRESVSSRSVCGDGVKETSEQCDDGNGINGDGCDRGCRLEAQILTPGSGCGNGNREGTEECDDGNRRDFDGCSASCYLEKGSCGDGIIQRALNEQCEPSIHDSSLPYGCGADCRFVLKFCGNGVLDLGEECDAGKLNGDRSDATCRSDCSLPRCGDGILDQPELCDDGNLLKGDGCNEYCMKEETAAPTFTSSASSAVPGQTPLQKPGLTTPLFASLRVFEPLGQQTVRTPPQGPAGQTGPASTAVMAAGAAAGFAWTRRRKRRE
jgi:cysteine-rich repeat protein